MTEIIKDSHEPTLYRTAITDRSDTLNHGRSAVSWAAILAGAVGAAALSLLLITLGTGLGFAAVSPWRLDGIDAATFGFAAIAWLTFTQIAASGLGGYLAGRLRTKWTSVHSDEVYFRDSAHGFLTWAVASLVTVVILTSMMGSMISGVAKAGSAVAQGASQTVGMLATGSVTRENSDAVAADNTVTVDYFISSLFRSNAVNQDDSMGELPVAEVTTIFVRALNIGTLPDEDKRYVGRLIVNHSDLSQTAAEQRVTEGFEKVQQALHSMENMALETAETARKSTAYAALWMFIALLTGAFTASVLAIFGGRQRDA